MSDAGDALHFVSRWLQGDGSVLCVSACGRYAAGDHCSHTLVVDALRRCYAVIRDVGPRYFETKTTEGGAELVLCAEGEDSRFHPCPPMTDLRWFALETSSEIEWKPWPDPRVVGVPSIVEHCRTAWTFESPTQGVDRPSAAGWLWRLMAIALLSVLLLVGRQFLLMPHDPVVAGSDPSPWGRVMDMHLSSDSHRDGRLPR